VGHLHMGTAGVGKDKTGPDTRVMLTVSANDMRWGAKKNTERGKNQGPPRTPKNPTKGVKLVVLGFSGAELGESKTKIVASRRRFLREDHVSLVALEKRGAGMGWFPGNSLNRHRAPTSCEKEKKSRQKPAASYAAQTVHCKPVRIRKVAGHTQRKSLIRSVEKTKKTADTKKNREKGSGEADKVRGRRHWGEV